MAHMPMAEKHPEGDRSSEVSVPSSWDSSSASQPDDINQHADQLAILPDTARNVADTVLRSLVRDKAVDQLMIPLADKTSIADAMIIASGTSSRHVSAIAEHIREALKKNAIPVLSMEGTGKCDWVVIDANHVVVHLFRPEVRDYYNLERLWMTDFARDDDKKQIDVSSDEDSNANIDTL